MYAAVSLRAPAEAEPMSILQVCACSLAATGSPIVSALTVIGRPSPFPPYLLAEGRISVLVQLVFYEPDIQSVVVPSVIAFEAVDSDDPLAVRGLYQGMWPGALRPRLDWTGPTTLA